MATLRGGARKHIFTNADGYRHEGPDLAGSVSFLPAGCVRKLELQDVEWRWAAIALDASLEGTARSLGHVPSLTVKEEPFVFGLLQEMERLDALAGGIEPIYAQTMTGALAQYMAHRFGGFRSADEGHALPPYKLRRVREFVTAHLGQRLSLADLAALCDLSERHFHRSFKATVGQTPLEFIIQQRMERAKLLLSSSTESIATIALKVGFANPGHFARAFVEANGTRPSAYRSSASVN
jgi:AraC family transcriptional regulator